MDISQMIRDLQAQGWSEVRIAAELGTTQTTVSRWRNGRTRRMYHDMAVSLAALHRRVLFPVEQAS